MCGADAGVTDESKKRLAIDQSLGSVIYEYTRATLGYIWYSRWIVSRYHANIFQISRRLGRYIHAGILYQATERNLEAETVDRIRLRTRKYSYVCPTAIPYLGVCALGY